MLSRSKCTDIVRQQADVPIAVRNNHPRFERCTFKRKANIQCWTGLGQLWKAVQKPLVCINLF
jgi:hypothetical protein